MADIEISLDNQQFSSVAIRVVMAWEEKLPGLIYEVTSDPTILLELRFIKEEKTYDFNAPAALAA